MPGTRDGSLLRAVPFAVLLLVAGSAGAQPVGQLIGALDGGGQGDAVVSDELERRAIERARRSFVHAARDLAARVLAETGAETAEGELGGKEAVDARIASAAEQFVARARERLVAEQDDGLLSRAELSSTLADAREARLDVLAEDLGAMFEGTSPPPKRAESSAWTGWAAATVRYTLLERNSPWRWAACLALLVAGIGVGGAAARALSRGAKRLEGRGARQISQAARSLSGPFYLATSALAVRVAVGWVWLPVGVAEVVRQIVTTLLALALLWVGWRAADGGARLVAWTASRTRGHVDDDLLELIRKGLRVGVLVAFAAFAVNVLLGIELGSIAAAVGVAGIVASIAAQDTLRNMMAALTVYGDRPFGVGDLVRIKDYFGTVEEVGFRSTRLQDLGGHRIVVPNAEVVREPVVNVSARPFVRHHYAIDLVYGTSPEELQRAVEIVEEILTETEHPDDQPPHVSFEELGAYSLRLMVWYYSNTSDYWEARAHRTEVNLAILERLGEAGLEFAFPTRSVHLVNEEEP